MNSIIRKLPDIYARTKHYKKEVHDWVQLDLWQNMGADPVRQIRVRIQNMVGKNTII